MPKPSNVNPGDRLGKLVIVKQINKKFKNQQRYYECICDCGNTTTISTSSFNQKKKKSCGCLKNQEVQIPYNLEDYVGKKFYKLLILENLGTYKKQYKKKRWFSYVCDCGKTGEICFSKIGVSKSCGCEYRKSTNNLSQTYVSSIEKRAKKKGLDFDIDREFLLDLFGKQNKKCALTGMTLQFTSRARVHDATASLDRIDSSRGYTKDNVQWLHKTVNFMKQKLTNEEFVDWCTIIVNHAKSSPPS